LVQAPAKRNTPLARANQTRDRPEKPVYSIVRLFNRDREPADQPCNLVQMLGIMFLDGVREPQQAFVVAQIGNIARHDRRHGSEQVGSQQIGSQQVGGKGWHRISSRKTLQLQNSSPIESNWRLAPCPRRMPGLHGRVADYVPHWTGNDGKSLSWRGFPVPSATLPEKDIWSFASPKGFVIRSPLANICFAYSSVAQR
jgi:hypothetical protein